MTLSQQSYYEDIKHMIKDLIEDHSSEAIDTLKDLRRFLDNKLLKLKKEEEAEEFSNEDPNHHNFDEISLREINGNL